MTILGVLQARMSSTRFPGKVLAPVLGEPMIGRQIERLGRSGLLDGLVVATSTDPSDDVLVAYLETLAVPTIRGSLDDVLGRFITVVDSLAPQAVVRLTADCPLASPAVIDKVIQEFISTGDDYVSNTLRPTYPDGLDVEVVKAPVLRWVSENSADDDEREHVTLGVYRRPERFALRNVSEAVDLSDLRWTVDNAADLEFVRWVFEKLYPTNPAFDACDVLDLLRREPAFSRTTVHAPRNAALQGLDTGAMDP